jgi:hypothetical protein
VAVENSEKGVVLVILENYEQGLTTSGGKNVHSRLLAQYTKNMEQLCSDPPFWAFCCGLLKNSEAIGHNSLASLRKFIVGV